MLSLDSIFSLLVTSVGNAPASALVEACKKENMNRQPYESMGVLDENLPEFDNGYVFEYSPEPGDILQAGLIISCRRKFFFSKARKYYDSLVRLADAHYGQGEPIHVEVAKSMNYGDATNVCYVARSRIGDIDMVAVKVGNREYWS